MVTSAPKLSKLTDCYQTTVPSSVRKHLNLKKGDQICYCTEPSTGRVYIEPVHASEGNAAVGAFLDLIEADIEAHPKRLQAFDASMHNRVRALVEHVEVDLDAALSPDDEVRSTAC